MFGIKEQKKVVAMKGKLGVNSVQVKHDVDLLHVFFSSYVMILRLPLSLFLLCMLIAPFVLSAAFVPLYLLDTNGLKFNDEPYMTYAWLREKEGKFLLRFIQTFFYSFSISTTMGGEGVEIVSIFALLMANLNTLCAQLLFVFISGAVFHRLSQPMSSVRFSKVAVISKDQVGAATGVTKYKAFFIRVVMAGAGSSVLVDAKFEISVKRFVRVPGQATSFIRNDDLKLVRTVSPYLNNGMVLRHVIDETSPLWGLDEATMHDEDVLFLASVIGMEEYSLKQIFEMKVYSAYDGDIMWDREFEDVISWDNSGKTFVDQTKLSSLKPLP